MPSHVPYIGGIAYPIHTSLVPCQQCKSQEFIHHEEVGEVCLWCLTLCIDAIIAPEEEKFEEAIGLYCILLQADKTPGN